jgi:hypothetical protein
MRTRPIATALAALAALATLAACSDTVTPTPAARGIERVDATARLVTHDFPGIQFPSGIANDGNFPTGSLYISTLIGARETYKIDPTSNTVTAVLPTGGNPRDIVWALHRGLIVSDMGNEVRMGVGGFGSPTSIPIPWRGGGIAHWRDTLYVGDLDTDSILVIPILLGFPSFIVRKFPTPTRNEGLVIDSTDVISSTATLWSISPFDNWMTEIDLQGNFIRRCSIPYIPGPFGLGGVTILRDSFFVAHPTGGDPFAGTTITRIARHELLCAIPGADSVDIEPRKFPNKVNPGSGKKIEVAVFTTPGRDATTLIPATVRFGRTGTEAPTLSTTITDVDGDGDLDVVFEFRTSATGILCGDTSARLRALATSGAPFDASDSIVTIGCGRGGGP